MDKIKSFLESDKGKSILTILIVILVGLGSFELGRLSKNSSSTGIKLEYAGQSIGQSANTLNSTNIPIKPKTQAGPKSFFASSRGHKYYPSICSAGKSIKMENRIYFTTAKDAEGAGYTLSSSCK